LDADKACEYLREAADLLREDPIRKGSLLSFGAAGQLVVTGDMHGHTRNFEKLQRFCDLERSPGRSVVLQEVIHAEPDAIGDRDLSIDLLVRVAEWKCQFPDNVFVLQSNHEMSQLCGHEITKGGRSVLHDFETGVAERYGKRTDDILNAVQAYLAALQLAAQTANGIFLAHSLPDPLSMRLFDESILHRNVTERDMEPGGSAYALVWGRFHTEAALDEFAERAGRRSRSS